MNYKEVILSVREEHKESLTGELLMLGFESFKEDDDGFHAFIPAEQWSDEIEHILRDKLLGQGTEGIPLAEFRSVQNIDDENWQQKWEESIEPVHIGTRVIVHPSWKPVDIPPGALAVTIDPKMSFGTGHHETTRLMIELLEHRLKAGMSVLDVGTGTGLLSIIAAKLGASKVIGIDNDADAYANALENCKLNEVSEIVTIYFGKVNDVPEIQKQTYNIILINIDRGTLVNILDILYKRLKAGGMLILSGILAEDLEQVREELLENKFTIIETSQAKSDTGDEWIALTATI
jgi:ribosomal protein L11 methyltransferase